MMATLLVLVAITARCVTGQPQPRVAPAVVQRQDLAPPVGLTRSDMMFPDWFSDETARFPNPGYDGRASSRLRGATIAKTDDIRATPGKSSRGRVCH
jgi:hypothetical protein